MQMWRDVARFHVSSVDRERRKSTVAAAWILLSSKTALIASARSGSGNGSKRRMITISIVSHGHGAMVERLLSQALSFQDVQKIILTLNIPEQRALPVSEKILVIRNDEPHGFGANHNAAFRQCETEFFCVLNPDVLFFEDPFPQLLSVLEKKHEAAVVAPLVVTSGGRTEDSARHFPTIFSLMAKLAGRADGRYPVEFGQADIEPDWIAGMFMLFRSADYKSLGGFDEAFFLYYEDVDICARVWKSGRKVVLSPSEKVIHDAQRASHKSWRFRRWHLQSLLRYLSRYTFRSPRER